MSTAFDNLKLDDVCTIGDGAHASIKRHDSGVLYLSSRNFKDGRLDLSKVYYICESDFEKHFRDNSKAITKPKTGDVVLSIIGTIGEPYVVRPADRFGLSSAVAILRPNKDDLSPHYLFYWIRGDEFQQAVYSIKGGVAQSYVSLEMIRSLPIRKFDKNIQNKIVDILSTYDNLIENNNRRIAILKEMVQSLYREWFVKFRFPGHDQSSGQTIGTATSDPEGASVKDGASQNTKFIDTPLGKIPEGWDVARLDDFVVLQRGFDLPKKKRNEEGGVPVYAASGINGFHDEVKVKGPGLVTGRSGTLGIVTLILEDFWPLNTTLWVKEFKNCSAFYGYYLLSSIGLEGYNSGAAVPTLNRNYIHGLPIISPAPDLIDEFELYVATNYQEIDVLKKKNVVLKAQRDMLLPRLISGSITIYGANYV